MIKLFTRARWSQSHTNNGFLKLVEALLQIYSCFFSHSIKLYVAYRYQQCHCLAALPAKINGIRRKFSWGGVSFNGRWWSFVFGVRYL